MGPTIYIVAYLIYARPTYTILTVFGTTYNMCVLFVLLLVRIWSNNPLRWHEYLSALCTRYTQRSNLYKYMLICCLRALFKFIHGFVSFRSLARYRRRPPAGSRVCILQLKWNCYVKYTSELNLCNFALTFAFKGWPCRFVSLYLYIWLYKAMMCVLWVKESIMVRMIGLLS